MSKSAWIGVKAQIVQEQLNGPSFLFFLIITKNRIF